MLGKAMYDGILIDVAFAGFFLAKVMLRFFINRRGRWTDGMVV